MNKALISHIVAASFIILYTFYSRLLIIRLPKSLTIINESTINYYLFGMVVYTIEAQKRGDKMEMVYWHYSNVKSVIKRMLESVFESNVLLSFHRSKHPFKTTV